MVLVVVRQELRLVRRHVDVHRAVALAALARQAQVERVVDLLALPSVGDDVTDRWQSEEVHDALDLCLSCKGCKGDCPVHVDMAGGK